MTPESQTVGKARFNTIHDKDGQEYRVRSEGGKVTKIKRLNSSIHIMGGHTIDLGIKRFKRSGASKKQVIAYKAKAHEELRKVHKPYIEKTARFEDLKFAKGVTVQS